MGLPAAPAAAVPNAKSDDAVAEPPRPLTPTEIVELRDRKILSAIRGYIRPLTEAELVTHMPGEAWETREKRADALRNVLARLEARQQVRKNPDGRWERL